MMGWDYYTYELQPPFFIEEILIFLKQENERDNEQTKALPKSSGGLKR
jgi:hypothetical protein